MSEFSENEKNDAVSETTDTAEYKDEYAGFETVFGDPAEHKNVKPKNNGKKRIVAVVASALAVAVLVGGTLAVIKFIPVKDDGNSSSSSPFEEIKVLEKSSDDLSEVKVTNGKGNFRLYSKTQEAESDESESSSKTVSWYLDGVPEDMVSTSSVQSVAQAAASITASRSINTKTAADCGLDNPVYTVEAVTNDNEAYTVLVGSDSPDGTGVYLKLSGDENIYIVDTSAVSVFDFEALDFADTTAFAAADFGTLPDGYADDNGALIKFDSATLTGRNYPNRVKIVPNGDGELSSYLAYIMTEPENRFADHVDGLLSLFASGVSVSGAYAYDVSPASLAKVGLDNPDVVAAMTVNGKTVTYKISVVDDTFCAVITDDSKMIRKVDLSSLAIAKSNVESFYSGWVTMQSINDLTNFTLSCDGTDYSFDIVYDDSDDAEETYTITANGKKIKAENFQNFYQTFVGLQYTDYSVSQLSAQPDATVKMTLKDGTERTVTFTKCSETKYQCTVDGLALGKITSSSYNKIIKNIKLAYSDKEVKT